jgi:hypothetical protein
MRAIDFLVEQQRLDEVNMSPRSLKMLVKSINATAGMEFEMGVPNIEDPDEYEYENDYDSDERASSWGNIEDFFMGGDGNNSRSDVRSMIESMQEHYNEWYFEQEEEAWRDEGQEFLKDYILENDEFDEDDAEEQAKQEIREANPELPEESHDFEELVRVRKDEIFEEFVQDEWDNDGRIYDRAKDEFRDNYSVPDEGDWLSDNYEWMTDVYHSFGNRHDVFWPYQTRSGGEGDLGDLADEFSRAIGRGVNTYAGHGGPREAGEYTIETDPSIDTDDSGDAGLEFVSPPLPLTELVADLATVVKWANEYGCYTNDSTGLHMSVSVPNYSIDKLDYVKLALLLGDEYVLQQFGRQSNNYCRSAVSKVKGKQLSQEESKNILDQMKNGLSLAASKLIHTGFTDKYTSINTKNGYVEFRSPGGDWLNEDLDKLTNTLYRFVVALDAACDPQKYKEDYYKKLYKMLNPDDSTDDYGKMINDFSQYATAVGGAPQKVVANFRRLALATLKQSQGKESGQWWFNVAINGQRIELVADSPEHAWEEAVKDNPHWGRMNKNDAKITRLRPFVDTRPANGTTAQATAGEPQPLSQPQQQQYQIYRKDSGTTITSFMAADDEDAMQRLGHHLAYVPSQAHNLYGVRRAQ